MAHVQITAGPGHKRKVLVDGVDMSRQILAEGFEIIGLGDVGPVHVRMTLVADTFELDAPDAVLNDPSVERMIR